MKYIDDFRNPKAADFICSQINDLAGVLSKQGKTVNIMEVCGSHTMAIGRFAIRELLPENVRLISGPGCPVCVTDPGYIDVALQATGYRLQATDVRSLSSDVRGPIIVTFGDMINVPGSESTLSSCRANGADIEVCYSPMVVLDFAKRYPDREIIFLAIGFETTIAPIMGLLKIIEEQNIENISFLTAFKLVPPALQALLDDPELKIDAFLCPAHVSSIIGARVYEPIARNYKIPCVIASFEPVEILYGLKQILKQLVEGTPKVENLYKRFVTEEGNLKAQELLSKYLEPYDALWRGIGTIPKSGLRLKKEYSRYDATKKFSIKIKPGKNNPSCRCADVLKGKILPLECPLFAKTCNPQYPIGPCMVSSEGSCSAYYKYSK